MGLTLAARVKANDEFDDLEEESQQRLRRPNIKDDVALGRLRKIFQNYLDSSHPEDISSLKRIGKTLPAPTIMQFSMDLADYESHPNFYSTLLSSSDLLSFRYTPHDVPRAAYFLNELIKACQERRIFVELPPLISPLAFIGAENRKKQIIVHGNLGFVSGYGMISGRLEIHGDVEDFVGYCMNGGEIHVQGNLKRALPLGDRPEVGKYATGGKIYCKGKLVKDNGVRQQ